MDLFKSLKNLKNIEADREFTKKSRSLLLNTKQRSASGFWGVVLNNIEVGASMALAGLLMFAILGGLNAWSFLSPVDITSLDPESLRAEAEAIDIQIELTNLSYEDSIRTLSAPESTDAVVISEPQNEQTPTKDDRDDRDDRDEPAELSIDEALRLLSQ